VLASRSSTNTDLEPYLFGSILTVDSGDVRLVGALALLIISTVLLTRRALFSIAFDEEAARVSGIPVGALNALLAAITAVAVVASMRVVGVLLVAALMILPVATSRVLARSFRTTMLGASTVGVVSVVIGLAASRAWGLASGGAIVLTAAALFVLVSTTAGLRRAATGAGGLLEHS